MKGMEKDQGTLLLVEDDEDDIELFRRAYQMAGLQCSLRIVRTGAEAINYLLGRIPYDCRGTNPVPFMVVLDAFLPGMSGFDLLRWLKENSFLSRLFVIMISVTQDRKDILQAYELGARSFVHKNAGFESIMEALKPRCGPGAD